MTRSHGCSDEHEEAAVRRCGRRDTAEPPWPEHPFGGRPCNDLRALPCAGPRDSI